MTSLRPECVCSFFLATNGTASGSENRSCNRSGSWATVAVAYTKTVLSLHIERGAPMRTNIEIDDDLMRAAMQATGVTTKKGAVEAALRRLVEIRADEAARKEAVRRGRSKNGQSTDEDWLDRWLASGWK